MKKVLYIIVAVATVSLAMFLKTGSKNDLPVVAIANLGPLKDLEISIQGLKDELADNGFVDEKTIKIEYIDAAFDQSLIPQSIETLKSRNPKIMVAVTTPVAQLAKKEIHTIPIVFHSITDPVAAGLLKDKDQPNENVTGASDVQNVEGLLEFAKSIFPKAKTIGMLCITSDSNDMTIVDMVKATALRFGLIIHSVPLEQPRDIPVRMQEFKGKVDLVYIGLSNVILSALPTISSEAKKMDLPIIVADDNAVREGLALASYGVNSESIGRNAGKLVVKLLQGADVKTLSPIYPSAADHVCVVNKKLAQKFKINIPKDAIIVE